MKQNHPIVDVCNLYVRFGEFCAVRDVSFSVSGGEIFGFLGANGAGKTTTIRVLCGLLPASDGRVIIDGHKFENGNANLIKQSVGYMSQHFTLYDGLSIKENFDFAAALRDLPESVYLRRRRALLKFIGFDEKLSTVVRDLPGGIKQEIALCVALLHDPKIIFLDEPTAGVAPVSRQRFWSLIKKLASDGKTIFVTTHYMDEAAQCDRVVVVDNGKVILDGAPRAVFSHVEQLKKVGLDVPQVTELVWMLRKDGYNLPDDIIFEDECVQAIEKLLEERHVSH